MLKTHMIPTSGDSTLLRFSADGKETNILIDGGNRKNDCIDYLRKLNISRIDLLIASHLDEDHIRGLRKVSNELDVKELWMTDVSPLVDAAAVSAYTRKCLYECQLIMDGKGVAYGNSRAVYEGHQEQIGPLYLHVLSPPKSLYYYLRQPGTIKRMLSSKKGRTIKQYIKKLVEIETKKEAEEGHDDADQREETAVSRILERFRLDIPQEDEIRQEIEKDEYDQNHWQEIDKYYESARSLFNDISIVVNIAYNYHGATRRFLFPGDLTNWSILLAKYPREIRRRILKIPHHGSEIYYDLEDYHTVLCHEYFPHSWRRLLPLLRHSWPKLEEELLMRGLLSAYFSFYSMPFGTLSDGSNGQSIYAWLAPKKSLIYPLKNRNLPKLSVLNQIVNCSREVFCTFRQGDIDSRAHMPSDSCIRCYNCTERDRPIVLE